MHANEIKILVVEDEIKLADVVKSYLENKGYTVYEAHEGRKALKLFDKINPSLVILDLMLPDISGEEICKTLRKKSSVPIIMLTAKVDEEDILKGLDIGADDYITKPFSPKQLTARAAALLRRCSNEITLLSNVMSYNEADLIINSLKHEVKKMGKLVNLTPNEYKILVTMARYPRKTFTREELISLAFDNQFDGYDRTIDSHIKNLRQKIEIDTKKPQYIITVHGLGYKFGGE